MPASQQQTNSQIRKIIRHQRREIPPQLRKKRDETIQRHLIAMVKSRQVRSLAGFWPFDGEPDLIPACKQLMADGCEIALPVISGDADSKMDFHHWNPDTPLIQNRYGISEPQKTIPLSLAGFDMLLMPLVGYDRTGNRIGMGSGYYDRHLEPTRDQQSPLRIGIAYQLQELEQITNNAWDVPLHGVINENGLVGF